MSSGEWEGLAPWWQREFTAGADPEYVEQILPMVLEHTEAGSRVVDLGCGEGQVSRMLAEQAGCTVVGVDAAESQVTVARELGGGPCYLRGSGAAVGLRTAIADQVVACLVLEHMADLSAALAEVSRLLRAGGLFLLLLNHPLTQTPDSGWIDDHLVDPPEQYWQLGPYLREATTVEQVESGVRVTFHHRPLSRYLNEARESGLVLEHMEEPAPPPGFLALAPGYADAASIPRLAFLRFRRMGADS